ncbi:MAG TPA: RsmD family RNA methyltransferase [Acetobacteraceae bacterium]|nr:RsmD family RNA methyltransferase [Acetobacteraceae bacterium]
MPPCPHFGVCGGCTLQDQPAQAYIADKCDALAAALRRAGFADVPLSPAAHTGPGERRRMDLAARRTRAGVTLGLHRQRSTEVVDLTTCVVLHPDLVRLLPPLRELLARLQGFRREASVIANLLDTGPDLLLRTDAPLQLADRVALTDFARAHALPRIAWAQGTGEPEPIAILRPPTTLLSGVSVTPPPGAFLQASAKGEAAIIAAVLDAIPAKGRVAELFAGCGTLSFALARRMRVAAWEGDAAASAALRSAANHAGLAGRIAAKQRDLARQPLQAKELRGFSAIVLDPPFAGAAAQVPQIATAKRPVVVYVSCNPATLARDARLLHQAGYRVTAATPIDQFLWSTRLESVVAFAIG